MSEVTVQVGMIVITWETVGSVEQRESEIDSVMIKAIAAFRAIVPDIDVMNELPGEVFN